MNVNLFNIDFKIDNISRTVAAVLQGTFTSAFPTPPNFNTSKIHKLKGTQPAVIFAISDVDWLFDPFSIQTTNINGRVVVRPLNDNLTFLLNMVEYASGEQSLINIRSKSRFHRPFEKVASLFKKAQDQLHDKETLLSSRVIEIERQIEKFAIDNGTTDLDLMSENIKKEVFNFRKTLINTRLALRNVRSEIRREVDNLGKILIVVNMASGPLLTGFIAILMFFFRKRMWL